MPGTKLLVIGLDAADDLLIKQWAAAGHLKTFRHLMESAAHGRVVNPTGLEAGSAWPTFYYGVSPARHGQYDGSRYYDVRHYHDGKFTPEMVYPTAIWDILSDAGKRVALIDAPYRFRTEGLNGIDIHDWGAHAPTGKNSFAKFSTNPPELAREIERRFGLDPLKGAMCDKIAPRTLDAQRQFRADMIDRVRRKTLMSDYYLATQDWDLFFTSFSECHCIGHHAWHIHDPQHPDHDPRIAAALGDPVLDVYQAVDRGIGELLERAGPETTVIVYCSHGMGTRYSGTKLLDKILARLDGRNPPEISSPLTRTMRAAWRGLPTGLRNRLKPTQAKLHKKIYKDGFQGDRAGRRFFEVLTNDRTAGVRINLIGRDPNGLVAPGAEFRAVSREIEEKLLRVINSDTGLPLVKEVHHTAEIHRGERSEWLPDLLVTWNRVSGRLSRISSPDIGEMRHENLSFRTGDHRPEGMFFAIGPGVGATGEVGAVSVMDFAPTIAAFFGLRPPETDGEPIAALAGVAAFAGRKDELTRVER